LSSGAFPNQIATKPSVERTLAPSLKGPIMRILLLAACSALLLAACDSKQEAAEDKMERAAETSATVAGPVPAALGLSEAQLLDADIVGADGKDLGDVSQVLRGADDKVDRLLVELDGIGPDRYVHVPVQGLKVVVRGDDTDLQTSMTKADLDAMPEVKLPAP
jgi:ABC-type amino acid transport substrate-binding protein